MSYLHFDNKGEYKGCSTSGCGCLGFIIAVCIILVVLLGLIVK